MHNFILLNIIPSLLGGNINVRLRTAIDIQIHIGNCTQTTIVDFAG